MTARMIAVAEAYTDAGRPEDAVAVLGPLLQAAPDDLGVLFELGRAELARGRNRRVHELMTHAIEVDPEQELPYRLLAFAYLHSRDVRSARLAALDARARRPDIWQSNYAVAIVGVASSRISDVERAAMRTALSLDPTNADLHVLAGRMERHDRRYPQAQRHFEEALRLDPEHEDAARYLGLLALHRHRPAAALANLFPMARRRPEDRWAAGVESAVGMLLIGPSLCLLVASLATGLLIVLPRTAVPAVATVVLVLFAAVGGIPVSVRIRRAGTVARSAIVSALSEVWGLALWAAAIVLGSVVLAVALLATATTGDPLAASITGLTLFSGACTVTLHGALQYLVVRRRDA